MYERVRRTFGRRPRSLARSCRRLTLAPERSRLFERGALSDPRAGRRALLLRETVCRTWGSAAIGLALAGVRVLSRNGSDTTIAVLRRLLDARRSQAELQAAPPIAGTLWSLDLLVQL